MHECETGGRFNKLTYSSNDFLSLHLLFISATPTSLRGHTGAFIITRIIQQLFDCEALTMIFLLIKKINRISLDQT